MLSKFIASLAAAGFLLTVAADASTKKAHCADGMKWNEHSKTCIAAPMTKAECKKTKDMKWDKKAKACVKG